MCLELGGRGFLRASKGLLGLEGGGECKVEVLRLWRVALSYGADLEGVLDLLAVLGG